MITYVNPVVAVLLGVTLLDEHIGIGTVAGMVLILALKAPRVPTGER